jgi:hypothetical protein
MSNVIFPKEPVSGIGFCDRSQERATIIQSIQNGEHMWIRGHRLSGKTSLIKQAKVDALEADKFIALNICDLSYYTGFDGLIKRFRQAIGQCMSDASAKWVHKCEGWDLESELRNLDALPLFSALQRLDTFARGTRVNCVIVIDDVHGLFNVENEYVDSIIADLTAFIDAAESVSLVFISMESDATLEMAMPFLTDTTAIALKAITKKEYSAHLNNLAIRKWDTNLQRNTLKALLNVTGCHPYYVNALCRKLWTIEYNPEYEDVQVAWEQVIQDCRHDMKFFLSQIKLNERKVLQAIAYGNDTQLSSRIMLNKMNISGSSLMASLKKLLIDGYILKEKNGRYRIVDPVLAEIVK